MLVVKNTGLQQRVQYCLITAKCGCYQKHVFSLYNTLCKSLHSMLSVILCAGLYIFVESGVRIMMFFTRT
jgi:hypothetical protein